jgi:hypothetical protein
MPNSKLNPGLYSVECKKCKKEFLTMGFPDDISGCIDDTQCPFCDEFNGLGDLDTKKEFLGEVAKTDRKGVNIMNKIKVDKAIGQERYENRSKLNQIEMVGIQKFYNSQLARGNLIYRGNYLYPETNESMGDEEILKIFLYRDSLYIQTIDLETEKESYYKMT